VALCGVSTPEARERPNHFYAGLDLSRKRFDVCVFDEGGV
jgi:hypothetical protein